MGMEYYQKQGKSKGKILFMVFGSILLVILVGLLIFYSYTKKHISDSETAGETVTSEETVDEETGETTVEYNSGFLSDMEALKEIYGAEISGEIEIENVEDLSAYGKCVGYALKQACSRGNVSVITIYGTFTQKGILIYLFPFSLDGTNMLQAIGDGDTQTIIINENGVYWAVRSLKATWRSNEDELEFNNSSWDKDIFDYEGKYVKLCDGESVGNIIDEFNSCITKAVKEDNAYFAKTTEGFNALVVNDMSKLEAGDNVLSKDLENQSGEIKASIEYDGETVGERFIRIMCNGEKLSYELNIKESKEYQPTIDVAEDNILTYEEFSEVSKKIVGTDITK
jgi:hypothetical protein